MAGPNPDHTEHPTPTPDHTRTGTGSPLRRTSRSRRRRATRTRTRAQPAAWTIEQIRALGAVTDLRTAAQILGLSANTAYALAQRDAFPVPVIRAGGQYRVSVQAILAVLDTPPPSPPPPLAAGGS
jgi:hypothetical protein